MVADFHLEWPQIPLVIEENSTFSHFSSTSVRIGEIRSFFDSTGAFAWNLEKPFHDHYATSLF